MREKQQKPKCPLLLSKPWSYPSICAWLRKDQKLSRRTEKNIHNSIVSGENFYTI